MSGFKRLYLIAWHVYPIPYPNEVFDLCFSSLGMFEDFVQPFRRQVGPFFPTLDENDKVYNQNYIKLIKAPSETETKTVVWDHETMVN